MRSWEWGTIAQCVFVFFYYFRHRFFYDDSEEEAHQEEQVRYELYIRAEKQWRMRNQIDFPTLNIHLFELLPFPIPLLDFNILHFAVSPFAQIHDFQMSKRRAVL